MHIHTPPPPLLAYYSGWPLTWAYTHMYAFIIQHTCMHAYTPLLFGCLQLWLQHMKQLLRTIFPQLSFPNFQGYHVISVYMAWVLYTCAPICTHRHTCTPLSSGDGNIDTFIPWDQYLSSPNFLSYIWQVQIVAVPPPPFPRHRCDMHINTFQLECAADSGMWT